MPELERKRQPALFEVFGWRVDLGDRDTLADIAGTLAAQPLPATWRGHPERHELSIMAVGAHAIALASTGFARRPANWVRKLQAAHTALNPALEAHGAILLPGPSPVAAWSTDEVHPEPHRAGLRIDLPFARESDFARLHAAVRILLPLLPALSAATPIRDGRSTDLHSARLHACLGLYDRHPARVGGFIPEPVFDPADHDRVALGPIAQELAASGAVDSVDAQELNLRAATTSFNPNLLRIHAIDAQENPAADMAVAEFTIAVLRALVAGRWSSTYLQRAWSTDDLMAVMLGTIRDGCRAVIAHRDYLFMLGLLKQERATGTELIK
ncbi:MAG: glutamate-cysteine ligase family protein, partial [Flavobacteriales bacterium]